MPRPLRVLCVVGARPNFMKIAPIVACMDRLPEAFETVLVHTGQHYDDRLSAVFFADLGIRPPDVNLAVGSGSHAQQTAAVLTAFEPVVVERLPDLVLVVGDVNSTLACALVAAKRDVPVAHVEAGLRSFDRTMPEEINRVLTDQISDLLFTTEAAAEANLLREGVASSKIHFVGNVMIDTLLANLERARQLEVAARFGVRPEEFVLMTLHRPSNVDDPIAFERLAGAIARIAQDAVVIFPVHPRTRPAVSGSAIVANLIRADRLRIVDPLGYQEFIGLLDASLAVLTDSGGLQEEATILGTPCLTLRENTERPITISHGTNRLVGTDPERILAGWRDVMAGRSQFGEGKPKGLPLRSSGPPPLWDGRAAERIVEVIRAAAPPLIAQGNP